MGTRSAVQLAFGFLVCSLGLVAASPATAAERPLPRGHEGEVTAIAFSADGKKLVTGGADRTVRVWDVEQAKELKSFSGHKNPVAEVMFSPDGKRIASQDAQDRSWNLWDLETGKQTGPLAGSHWGASFTPDSERFVSVADQADQVTRRRWNALTGAAMAPPPEFKPPLPANAPQCKQTVMPGAFAYSPDGNWTAALGETRVQGQMFFEAFPWLAVRDRAECLVRAHRPTPRINTGKVLYTPDGNKLLASTTGPRGSVTHVYDPKTLNEQGQIPARGIGVASDNKHLLGRGDDGAQGLYDISSGKRAAPLTWDRVTAVSPKTPLLAHGTADGVSLVDLDDVLKGK